MAANDGKGTGASRGQRPEVRPSVPAGKPPETAAESRRGETIGKSGQRATALPDRFGRYRVKKKLGGGGMGAVYLVENTELEREEALKVPHFDEGDDPQVRERFLREAKSAAKLDHPNLCPVYTAGVQDGIYYMTMRFLKGTLLADYTGKAQPARKAVEVVIALARALAVAHVKGVIHRDLKPANVMMVAGVGPVVMDFGLAKQVHQSDQKLTKAGSMLGTPAYMPPEQVNGELDQMGPASDVYSLGVILYELLTGRLPFEGTIGVIFGQILYVEPPLPSTLVPGLNSALNGICQKAMSKESAGRYASMGEFAIALSDFLRSSPATEGAGDLKPAAGDEGDVIPVAKADAERRSAGRSAVSQAPAEGPGPRAVTTERPARPAKETPLKRKRSRPIATPSKLPWLAGGAGLAIGLLAIALAVFWPGRARSLRQDLAAPSEAAADPGDPFVVKSVWAGNDRNTEIALTVTKRSADKFTARFEQTSARLYIEREVTGTIDNGSICWLAKDVRILRAFETGGTGPDHYGTIVRDDAGAKIDFVWTTPSGQSGNFTLRLKKGK
jgi:predicted Ser/Thr protein kinase